MAIVVVTDKSIKTDVAATAATSSLALVAGTVYRFISTTACWIKQGATPTASAASGSMFVAANEAVYIDGRNGAGLSVIRNAADGTSTLTPCQEI